MDEKWKLITDIKEIGDKTDKVETVDFPEYISSNCSLTTCRYNKDGKCTNEEKRKECVRVSKAVLLLDDLVDTKVPDNQWAKKRKPFNVCETNYKCTNDPSMCSYAVEYSTLEDVGNGIHKYMCGRDKCKYCK